MVTGTVFKTIISDLNKLEVELVLIINKPAAKCRPFTISNDNIVINRAAHSLPFFFTSPAAFLRRRRCRIMATGSAVKPSLRPDRRTPARSNAPSNPRPRSRRTPAGAVASKLRSSPDDADSGPISALLDLLAFAFGGSSIFRPFRGRVESC